MYLYLRSPSAEVINEIQYQGLVIAAFPQNFLVLRTFFNRFYFNNSVVYGKRLLV